MEAAMEGVIIPTHPNSWGTISKKGNTSVPSSSSSKGIEDLIAKENIHELFSAIVKKDIEWYTKTISDTVLYIEQEDIPLMKNVDKLRQKYLVRRTTLHCLLNLEHG